jgi:hypothetical protein
MKLKNICRVRIYLDENGSFADLRNSRTPSKENDSTYGNDSAERGKQKGSTTMSRRCMPGISADTTSRHAAQSNTGIPIFKA